MTYRRTWFHGRRGPLPDAIARYNALFLTADINFAETYGDVYEITLRPGLRVFDTGEPEEVSAIVRFLWRDYQSYLLDPELDGLFQQLERREGKSPQEISEQLENEIAPDGVSDEYSAGAFLE